MEKLTTSLHTIACTISCRFLRERTFSLTGIVVHFSFIFSLIISLLIHIASLLHFKTTLSLNCILRQQTAQDTLISKPHSPSKCCFCSGRFSLIHNFHWFDRESAHVGVKSSTFKIQDFALRKNVKQCVGLDPKISTLKSSFKQLFLETSSR